MDPSPSRSAQRARTRRRRARTLWVLGGIVAIALVVVGAVLLMSGGSDDGGDTGSAASTPGAQTTITLDVGEVGADSAGAPTQVTAEQAAAVVDQVEQYVRIATVAPLRSGKPVGDLAGVFDAATLARVTGPDRGVTVDEGLPRVTGDLTVAGQPVKVTGLGDKDGNLLLVTASVDLDITGATDAAKDGGKARTLHIVRRGDLVLTPDPAGVWKVTAFTLGVARDGTAIPVPTTTVPTAAPSTTAATR